MILKDPDKMLQDLLKVTPKMLLVIADATWWAFKRGKILIWTEFLRTPEQQLKYYEDERAKLIAQGKDPALAISKKTSVHESGRGGDARLLFPPELNQQLMDYINAKYPYDPTRPHLRTVIQHEGTSDHLHFQTID